jgi:hypothetical protein
MGKIKKCKILNKQGKPVNLYEAIGIKLIFPCENKRELIISVVSILNAQEGIIQFSLSEKELQGFSLGLKQNFIAEVYFQGHKEVVLFAESLNIIIENERKVWK